MHGVVMAAGQQTEISDSQVIAIVEHFNSSFALIVRLMKKELSLVDCKSMNRDSYINLRHRLNLGNLL